MKNKTTGNNEENYKKWENIFENDNHISIWRYDSRKSMINPYEVEIKYKNEDESEIKKKKTK
jgi:hypothetical protein